MAFLTGNGEGQLKRGIRMIDISTELYNISTASRGETVRDAVVSAIKKLNNALDPPEESED